MAWLFSPKLPSIEDYSSCFIFMNWVIDIHLETWKIPGILAHFFITVMS